MPKKWHIYIVECSDGTYYTGITKNIKERIEKHNSGKGSRYTRSRSPVKLLIKSKNKYSYSTALKNEHYIKNQPKDKKTNLVKKM
jgi:putative endonuclease